MPKASVAVTATSGITVAFLPTNFMAHPLRSQPVPVPHARPSRSPHGGCKARLYRFIPISLSFHKFRQGCCRTVSQHRDGRRDRTVAPARGIPVAYAFAPPKMVSAATVTNLHTGPAD